MRNFVLWWRSFGCSALLLGLLACSSAAGGGAGGPLPGSTAGGQPVGLFYFIGTFNYNDHHTYYFTPAAEVYVDPTDFTPAGLAAVAPSSRGTYTIAGSEMTIKWANGETTSGDYHYDPTGFGCRGSFMCVKPFDNAQQLVGTFEGRNAAVSVDANSLVAYNTLTLKPDGTFASDVYAAGHAESRHSDGSAYTTDAASDNPQQPGRWTLDGWYLTLTSAQGTTRAIAYRTDWDEQTDKTKRFNFKGTTSQATSGQ